MRRATLVAGVGALLALGPAASLAKPPKPPEREETLALLAQFQERDQRLQNVGWRLVSGNAPFCDRVKPAVGLQVIDVAGYGAPETVRSALGLERSFGVQNVAAGSPAARSGAFAYKREISRIGDEEPNAWPANKRLDWKRLARAYDVIDAQAAEGGAVTIGFADGSETRVEAVPVCATRFELLTGSKKAAAEGARVLLGAQFPGFAWEEDEVFAGVVAHELAHNLLHHRDWLDRNTRKRKNVRLTEREADRLMPWLLANAGYDPAAAYRFMVRWGKSHDLGIFRKRTHDGWDERAEFIEAELPIIAELLEREGHADWSVHFRREIDASQGLNDAPDD